ncbi:hypothetical protein SAMN05421770_107147 [Granulicella rosea]|uniref:Uncharacterized protein n=1 Tax=Granulicella rosea TaxID=474952 RepID=A0A239LMP3_9BACT|nr:hypothetical protein SAMN05421770_107147 [Granulicella rosea]
MHGSNKPTIYARADVEKLTGPLAHTPWWTYLFPLGIGGGIITGAVYLSSVTIIGAIPVAVVGGFFLLYYAVYTVADARGADDATIYRNPMSGLH